MLDENPEPPSDPELDFLLEFNQWCVGHNQQGRSELELESRFDSYGTEAHSAPLDLEQDDSRAAIFWCSLSDSLGFDGGWRDDLKLEKPILFGKTDYQSERLILMSTIRHLSGQFALPLHFLVGNSSLFNTLDFQNREAPSIQNTKPLFAPSAHDLTDDAAAVIGIFEDSSTTSPTPALLLSERAIESARKSLSYAVDEIEKTRQGTPYPTAQQLNTNSILLALALREIEMANLVHDLQNPPSIKHQIHRHHLGILRITPADSNDTIECSLAFMQFQTAEVVNKPSALLTPLEEAPAIQQTHRLQYRVTPHGIVSVHSLCDFEEAPLRFST